MIWKAFKRNRDHEPPGHGAGDTHAFVDGEGLTLEQARATQEEVLSRLGPTTDENDAVNAASKLLLAGRFQDSITAYEAVAARFPSSRGTAEGQIGAACFFLGEHRRAVDHYLAAIAHGEDQGMMDDNIWEACEVLQQQGQGGASLYLQLLPQGRYARKAAKLAR